MPEIRAILDQLMNEKVPIEQIEQAANQVFLGDLEIPKGLSIQSTITEIESISTRLYNTLKSFPRDTTIQSKIITLLEMKTRILGMTNIKPEMQDMIDAEVNTYKKRFLEVAANCIEKETLSIVVDKLSAEGL